MVGPSGVMVDTKLIGFLGGKNGSLATLHLQELRINENEALELK